MSLWRNVLAYCRSFLTCTDCKINLSFCCHVHLYRLLKFFDGQLQQILTVVPFSKHCKLQTLDFPHSPSTYFYVYWKSICDAVHCISMSSWKKLSFLLLINFFYELHKQCTAATKDATEASMNVMFRDIDCDYSTVTDLIYSTLCLKKTRLL